MGDPEPSANFGIFGGSRRLTRRESLEWTGGQSLRGEGSAVVPMSGICVSIAAAHWMVWGKFVIFVTEYCKAVMFEVPPTPSA